VHDLLGKIEVSGSRIPPAATFHPKDSLVKTDNLFQKIFESWKKIFVIASIATTLN
jgi:hypothetical protein